MVQRVRQKIAEGGIVLMHPTENTVSGLPAILQLLEEKKLSPVSVGQLLKAKVSL